MTKVELLLLQLAEESAKVTQMVSKSMRFGLDEIRKGISEANRQQLEEELVDLLGVIKCLENEGVVNNVLNNETGYAAKIAKIDKHVKYSEELGIVEPQKYILRKVSDDVFEGNHPNFVLAGMTWEGSYSQEPTVGKRFHFGTSRDRYHNHLRTSTVQEVLNDGVFKTNNSTYKLEKV